VVYFFLQVEARRFRAYEASRYRVLMLERFFFPHMLGASVPRRWVGHLAEVLIAPELTVNYLGALGWRLRRNYLWIYVVVFIAWIAKLYVQGPAPLGADDWIGRAAFAFVPGSVVAFLVGCFALFLVVLAAGARRIYPFGDEQSREMMEHITDE